MNDRLANTNINDTKRINVHDLLVNVGVRKGLWVAGTTAFLRPKARTTSPRYMRRGFSNAHSSIAYIFVRPAKLKRFAENEAIMPRF